jgi:glycosyltransferase involved in cell wall biosynthesis
MLCGLRPWDALVCSSRAGLLGLQSGLALVKERLSHVMTSECAPSLNMPIIPLAIDVAALARDETEWSTVDGTRTLVVLSFGRLSHRSKAALSPLLLAFAAVSRTHPAATLVIAGDDREHRMAGEIRRFAQSLGCGNVRSVPDPTPARKRQLFREASIIVAISDNVQETFGLSIVEAMAAGLPVVASNWSGFRDLVAHGETGFSCGRCCRTTHRCSMTSVDHRRRP